MTVTLDSLLTKQTAEQIFQTMLGVLQANGFPTQSWQEGGVERTRLMAQATALADVSGNYIPAIAGASLLDYSKGAWLTLHGSQNYDLERNPATNTLGLIRLNIAAGVPSQLIKGGDLTAAFAVTGHRFLNAPSFTLPAGPSTFDVEFIAEFPGAAYNANPSNSGSLTLVTPIPGVTLTNPAYTFTPTVKVGSGGGMVVPSGSPVAPHWTVIRIDTSGASGVASWSYSIDGAPFVSAGAVGSASNLGGTGIDVMLNNDPGGGLSFAAGDTHSFANPGSWITQQGADEESDESYASRLRLRWTSLSAVPTAGYYELLARSTPSVGAQVSAAIVVPDQYINDKINIVTYGPAGILPPATIAAVQTFVSAHAVGTDNPVVRSPELSNTTLAGTITVAASKYAAAVSTITVAVTNFVNGSGINPTLRIAKLIDLVMNVDGVEDFTDARINGSTGNVVYGGPGAYVLPSLVSINFGYVTV